MKMKNMMKKKIKKKKKKKKKINKQYNYVYKNKANKDNVDVFVHVLLRIFVF
jgi:hypothetical protein